MSNIFDTWAVGKHCKNCKYTIKINSYLDCKRKESYHSIVKKDIHCSFFIEEPVFLQKLRRINDDTASKES